MHKYCIALRNPTDSECRVRVGEFPNSERAFQLAELIALELSIEADARWSGWTVEVRDLQGERLFATSVSGEAQSYSRSGVSTPSTALELLFN